VIVGPYDVTPEMLAGLALNAADSWRVCLRGLPRAAETTPAEIAAASLRRNARAVLWAGEGHFRFLWIADFGKALTGAWAALGVDYLAGQIDLMTRESARLGRVPSCFRAARGFDMPWHRGDGLPWLIFSHAELAKRRGRVPDEGARRALQELLDRYESAWIENGLVSERMAGDWVDTIRRPSSTYNNLCVLMMLRRAPELGLQSRNDANVFAERLFKDRWRADHFRDHARTDAPSVDAAVLALYLRSYPRETLAAAADRIESLGLDEPWPMRVSAEPYDPRTIPLLTRLAPGYHRAHWLHLGLMWLNGRRGLGRDVARGRAAVEALILRHGVVPEAVEPDGSPYRSFFISCERGLTMAAGQYLELAGPAPETARSPR
jgi:hypothetical protein